MMRPSYVLGGRAMEIVADGGEIDRYVARLSATLDQPSELAVSDKRPLLIDRYLADAIEVDVDCLCDGKDTFIAGIMEHIEEAGIHSGDSACSLPPHSLASAIIVALEKQTRDLALALNVVGLMNVQYAIKGGDIYILEVNPRASRTVPFVAKVIGKPIAGIAARVMNGEPLASFKLKAGEARPRGGEGGGVPVRALPRRRSDPGPGDALDRRGDGHRPRLRHGVRQEPARRRQHPAAARARCSSRCAMPTRKASSAPMRDLVDLGFRILATRGTRRALAAHGIPCEQVNKVLEGRPHIVDLMKNGEAQLVFNTTEGAKALADSKDIRRTALLNHIPYYTTLAGALAATQAIKALAAGTLTVAPLQSYVSDAS